MKRILFVDDEKEITDLYGLILMDLGNDLEITIQNSWSEAVFIIEEAKQPFDLVITDFCMPKSGQGLKVIEAARRSSVSTKVILMSSDVTRQDLDNAKADMFISKPCDPRILIAAVKGFLEIA